MNSAAHGGDGAGKSEGTKMKEELLKSFREQLQRERRALVDVNQQNDESLNAMSENRESELEEEGQQDRDSRILAQLDEQEQARVREIDTALERMDAGVYGTCTNCGNEISQDRLRAVPTTTLCERC